ncbi:MAG: prolipoprotein diacylglyceryl transferase [Acidobacteria bacterium ACB2]|nr:prolipoprotein diacylglyceryl transferase [Acidobacteria bacterium ACB2]
MLPELFRIGSFGVPTYGVLLATGFLLALWLLRRRSPSFGVSPDDAADLGIWVLLGGLVGAKLLLVFVEGGRYLGSVSGLWELLRSGGVFYGGLIGAVAVALVFLRRKRLSFLAVADAAAPSIALGQAIGRLGCFAAGCCWGTECHRPWAVTFTSPVAETNVGVPLGVPLHPVQLYEAAGTFVLFALLLLLERRRYEGQTFARYLGGYALLRGTLELCRGDPRGSVLGLLSTSQVIALAGLAAALAIAVAGRRRALRAPSA